MRAREQIEKDTRNGGNSFALLIEIMLDVRELLLNENEESRKRDKERAFIAQNSALLAKRIGLPTELHGPKPNNTLTPDEIATLMQESFNEAKAEDKVG